MIEALMDKSPCDGCPATKKMWSAERCIAMGACWMTEPSILDQILREERLSVVDLHEPPRFLATKKEVDGAMVVEMIDTEQKLNAMGLIVKEKYAMAVRRMRRKRLSDFGIESR
jgi:hypothetical protein